MTTKRKSSGVVDALEFMDSLDGPMTMARLIDGLRECDALSHAEMARKLGISRQNLYAIERGKAVSVARAASFAKRLGQSTKYFVMVAIGDELRRAGIEGPFNFNFAA